MSEERKSRVWDITAKVTFLYKTVSFNEELTKEEAEAAFLDGSYDDVLDFNEVEIHEVLHADSSRYQSGA